MMFLTRNKVYEKQPPSKDAKKIYLVCEGSDNEIKYFEYFNNFSKNLEIVAIKPENGQTDPVKLMDRAKILFFGDSEKNIQPQYELNTEYGDLVWFIIDTDEWNVGNKINKLREYCQVNNKESEMWKVAQSNPSFEQWQYYHFHHIKPEQSDVDKCVSFKEYTRTKITGGFDNRKHPINIEVATTNSKSNFIERNGQPDIYCTDLFLLGELICKIVETELAIAKKITKANASS